MNSHLREQKKKVKEGRRSMTTSVDRLNSNFFAATIAVILISMSFHYSGICCSAFVVHPLGTRTYTLQQLNNSPRQPTADFEYQELQIQMNAMKEQNIKPSELTLPKRNELKEYVEKILSHRQKSSKSVDSSVPLQVRLRSGLPGTKWRMAFTTQTLMAEALPKDATITLSFSDGDDDNKVDYGLDFFKTLALKKLVAQSTYTVMDPMSNNPTAAIVEIMYDNISTDVFGFTNIGIGTFGFLRGRSTYIQTVYFDNNIWIESGVEGEGNNSQIYYNVYARDDD